MFLVPARLLERLSAAYEAVASESRLQWMERAVIRVSLWGLCVHLLLIGLGRAAVLPAGMADAVGTSFLSALYTPFSFILFYEVLLLVLSLPSSMTVSSMLSTVTVTGSSRTEGISLVPLSTPPSASGVSPL